MYGKVEDREGSGVHRYSGGRHNSRRITAGGRRVLAALMSVMVLITGFMSREAEALNFPVESLNETAARSEVVFVGTVTGRTEEDDALRYTIRVDMPLKGGLEKKSEITARIVHDEDESVLDKGSAYLVLLQRAEDGGFAVNGTKRGFVKLKNGRAESKVYSQEEVDRYLARYGLKVKSIYERLVPANSTAVPSHSVRDATTPAMLWTGGAALTVLLAWLFARAIRQRRNRV